jgi:peptide/nickel transport system permease protein
MPAFWIGILLIYIFFYRLKVAAAPLGRLNVDTVAPPNVTGLLTVDSLIHGNWAAFADTCGHLALPAVTLAITVSAPLVRITRATMLEVIAQPFITCDRALGLPERVVVMQDGLRNSLVAVLTVTGLIFGYLVSSSVLVEQVFAWPGIGGYAFDALVNNDFAAIQGFVLVVAVTYVAINWAVDALYGVIDPRVRV